MDTVHTEQFNSPPQKVILHARVSLIHHNVPLACRSLALWFPASHGATGLMLHPCRLLALGGSGWGTDDCKYYGPHAT